jgi:pilus assembly protein Flp/PilA
MRGLVQIQLFVLDLGDRLRTFTRDGKERGASAVEYALLIALIAAVIVVAVYMLGKFVSGTFKQTCETISTKATGAGASVPACTS